MSGFVMYFTDGSRRRQFLLAGALALLLCGVMAAAWFVLHPRYQVLFSDLRPQDASSIIAALEKQKVPYRIDEKSSAILVPEGDTRALRLKLMSGDLRLQGAVGFELFNNSDLGLTDFAQKVNYQRALQGELARTIMTLDDIDLARVHLTLPESSIFHRDAARPKASVALFMRDRHPLAPETVRGIQRLVAATVPELTPTDVIVVDQTGDLANSRGSDIDDPKFILKQAIEQHYERKILALIQPFVGPNGSSVSVDARLDFDQTKTTRESDMTRPLVNAEGRSSSATTPLPGASGKSGMPTGLAPLPSSTSSDGTKVDRRLEQIVSEPGSIRRLSVGIVLDRSLTQEELTRLQAVVGASIGIDPARGDVLSIQTGRPGSVAALSAIAPFPSGADEASSTAGAESTISGSIADTQGQRERSSDQPAREPSHGAHAATDLLKMPARPLIASLLGLIAFVVIAASILLWHSRRKHGGTALSMSQAQRDQYVMRLRALLADQGAMNDRA
ncbi:flagellar basal-body MS-ring/collar protein FliF [Burkholderia sp. PAMC 28687]|uniref:flagellar basal-body MS-ring/collar protein FliF n=1 Tax=Burkholderia sp. PAMC 28687 TaxID=1795874 RepID=UPI000B3182F1|nr:flagellar basal-body MS-ring/collar protein FliF [Burkholderia sp. PAMC 28687]